MLNCYQSCQSALNKYLTMDHIVSNPTGNNDRKECNKCRKAFGFEEDSRNHVTKEHENEARKNLQKCIKSSLALTTPTVPMKNRSWEEEYSTVFVCGFPAYILALFRIFTIGKNLNNLKCHISGPSG